MSAATSREGYIGADGAQLWYRDVGAGRPIIVIHGGPDFDHTYLLPDMDRLADAYRLVYYDQRGRGRSHGELRLGTLGIEQYVRDVDAVREHLRLDAVAMLGHSWGGHVAMHYAIRCPDRVSQLILLNTAPASNDDWRLACEERLRRLQARRADLDALASSRRYREGDPDAVTEYYRIVFRTAFARPELVERLTLRWTMEDILRGRAIEERLMRGLYWTPGFTILPELAKLDTAALVVHGDADFIPVRCAARIADAIPRSRLVVIPDCGHFAYIEAARALHEAIDGFLSAA